MIDFPYLDSYWAEIIEVFFFFFFFFNRYFDRPIGIHIIALSFHEIIDEVHMQFESDYAIKSKSVSLSSN